MRVFEEEKSSTLGTAVSPLFIEVESCRAVEEAHLALAVTKSWERAQRARETLGFV